MNTLPLVLVSVLLYVAGAFASLLLASNERLGIRCAGLAGSAAALAGLAASAPALLSGQTLDFASSGPFPFARFVVHFDLLAALMVFVISLLALAASVYSLSYVREYEGRGAWAMGFFMNLFIASMLALVVVDNAFYFLIFFEMMSLASYFLVISEQSNEAVKAGFLYFLIAHAGSVLIMLAFFLLYQHSGSLDFASFRHLHLSTPLASAVFLLAFFGFGAKAGMVPLHGWLPRAHPAAPSHASAMMSGVMVKIGIFGIIRVGVDILGATTTWWGLLVLAIGGISAVLGVLYALAEHDIKRLLAYHSVENIGIILMGVGAGMVGMATHQPLLAVLGLLAGLYHLLNHAVFKGLLFLGAGSVVFRLHTKDMEKMGGLGRRMPLTALTFLIGAMAISALPPLNGFVSEWFTYQSLFTMSLQGSFLIRLAGPIVVVMLAITGALAVMCFVKVYGVSFSGAPRSPHAAEAREVPAPMIAGMALLALACIALGLGAALVAPVIAHIASQLAATGAIDVASQTLVYPGSATRTALSTPLVAILLAGGLLVTVVLGGLYREQRQKRRHGGDAWACGYAHDPRMVVSAGNFAKPLREMFAPLYRLRQQADPSPAMRHSLSWLTGAASWMEPRFDDNIVAPMLRGIHWLGRQVQRLQHGDFRIYCLYIVAALVILIVLTAA
ncbi:hydrogenase 4 subunit B [Paludibacterium yongneupense]|uniref:hydrogenase 4 subunit B n=1 Tax=Paludibacterium yongneupense TaxID=400061 RepID=UPI00041ABFC4|nr:hydrogenase 4 subunit B [Paludibacterium yongneupense]